MFCNIKKFLVTERNFLSQEEEIYFTVKKYLPEEIVWPKTFLFNWKSIKSIYPMGKLLKRGWTSKCDISWILVSQIWLKLTYMMRNQKLILQSTLSFLRFCLEKVLAGPGWFWPWSAGTRSVFLCAWLFKIGYCHMFPSYRSIQNIFTF